MIRDLGASAVRIAAEQLRAACVASAASPAAAVLHETFDHVLAEPVPVDMRRQAERIGGRKRQ